MKARRPFWLTNAFSRKLEKHVAAIALHFMCYTFVSTRRSVLLRRWLLASLDLPHAIADIVRLVEELQITFRFVDCAPELRIHVEQSNPEQIAAMNWSNTTLEWRTKACWSHT